MIKSWHFSICRSHPLLLRFFMSVHSGFTCGFVCVYVCVLGAVRVSFSESEYEFKPQTNRTKVMQYMIFGYSHMRTIGTKSNNYMNN